MERSSGFSLIELVAIMVILGLLSFAVVSRFNPSSYQVIAARDDIVAGLFYAQQVAIARGDSSTIQFVASADSIDVREDGNSLSGGSGIYPLDLPDNMTLDRATLNYDKLGRTTATTLTLTDGTISVDITISGSGYAQ